MVLVTSLIPFTSATDDEDSGFEEEFEYMKPSGDFDSTDSSPNDNVISTSSSDDLEDVEDMEDDITDSVDPQVLLRFIKSRRSIRYYRDEPVDREQIDMIIEAGRYTPTASNRQALTFIVVEKEMQAFRPLAIESLADLGRFALQAEGLPPLLLGYANRWLGIEEAFLKDPGEKDTLFYNTPLVILVAGDNPIDAGLAASNMELVACAQGLGVLYSGFLTRSAANEKVKGFLNVPEDKEVLITLLVGHPDVKYRRTAPRKKADIIWT